MKRNTLVWIILLALTVLGFFLGEHEIAATGIVLVAGLKCFLVGWHFMEMRHATMPWRLALAGILFLLSGMILILR